ncbi:MAG: DNA primase [Leadbetterella sp.]
MIPNDTVQRILAAADIVEVVGDFVSLKKRGSGLIACCPFHNEKTPSFQVSPAKGIYKCFGCGKGGDAIGFVMELEGLSYPEALKWMAKKYSIEIVEKEMTSKDLEDFSKRESLFIVLEFAQDYFIENLLHTDEGKSIGGTYFAERGFVKQEIETFKLGYAPDSRNDFYKLAIQKGFSEDVLLSAGLISKKEDGDILDRFRGRVIFPIHNTAGKPIAFGARILKLNPKAPKYINSPETEVYSKSHIVYGIHQAKGEIRTLNDCFLVEGYTDVVSLHQAGIYNVVASSGTSLTPDQVRLIRRFTPNITVLYDGDNAGIKASLRGIDIILEEGMDVKSVVFPNGDDPDSYIRKVGGEAFKDYIKKNQKDFIRFKTEISLQDIGDDPIKKAALIQDLVESIVKIPSAVKRSVFFQEVSKLLGVDENILLVEGNKLLKISPSQSNRLDGGRQDVDSRGYNPVVLNSGFEPVNKMEVQEESLVQTLVLFGDRVLAEDSETQENIYFATYIFQETQDIIFVNELYAKIYSEYKALVEKGDVPSVKYFTSHSEEAIRKLAFAWENPNHELSENWVKHDILISETADLIIEKPENVILRIRIENISKEIDKISEELDDASPEDFEILLSQLEKKIKIKSKLSGMLGVVVS